MGESDAIGARIVAARPRAVAALVRYFREVDLAEDAFQEAALKAMKSWTVGGVPDDPVAWLAFAGRNAGIDLIRRSRRSRSEPLPAELPAQGGLEDRYLRDIELSDYRDDVLRLLFMCCHPELSIQDQLALALKVVAGLSVPEIARAFVIQPKAMEQRLTRARKRAGEVAAALTTPSPKDRTHRVDAVSSMLYLMFSQGYSASGGDVHIRRELCDEAIRLTRLLLGLFPDQAEVMGLLALCVLQHSRREARLSVDGSLISLEDQDRSAWDRQLIEEGLILIEKALRHRRPGRFQIQAAIAAVHSSATSADRTDWPEITRLYAALEQVVGSPVVSLNRAVAVDKTEGPAAALEIVETLESALGSHLYFFTTRGALRAKIGDRLGACADFQAALGLDPTLAEREYINGKLREFSAELPSSVGSGEPGASLR